MIQPGDVVVCTVVGDEPSPHYFWALVKAIHDDYVWVFDSCDFVKIKRSRIITPEQVKLLRARYLRGEEGDYEC